MIAFERSARFEEFEGHRAPVLRWHPREGARAHAVFFAPFGDEMNQSRRMFRLAAEALASHGVGGCVFDLRGTGDSSADFADATLAAWFADCRAVLEPLSQQREPVVLIGCRLGVALAVRASHSLALPAAAVVGWAPVLQGAQQLQGLLRASRIARMARGDDNSEEPKTRWAAGRSAWLAGYPISALLAEQLGEFDAREAPNARRAVFFEVRTAEGGTETTPPNALMRLAAVWSEQGVPTDVIALKGASFWNVSDLVDVPELIEATVRAVDSAVEVA